MKRSIILEHYSNPKNKGLIDDDSYIKTDTNNESCIDEIHLMVKIDNGKIVDARFDGEACAICTSSTSIMIDTLQGKTIKQAKEIIQTFIGMIKREITDEEELKKLEDAIAFRNISNMPARVKCALLAWHTMEDILNKNENK